LVQDARGLPRGYGHIGNHESGAGSEYHQVDYSQHGEGQKTIELFDRRQTAQARLAQLVESAEIHDVVNPIETDWDAVQ